MGALVLLYSWLQAVLCIAVSKSGMFMRGSYVRVGMRLHLFGPEVLQAIYTLVFILLQHCSLFLL